MPGRGGWSPSETSYSLWPGAVARRCSLRRMGQRRQAGRQAPGGRLQLAGLDSSTEVTHPSTLRSRLLSLRRARQGGGQTQRAAGGKARSPAPSLSAAPQPAAKGPLAPPSLRRPGAPGKRQTPGRTCQAPLPPAASRWAPPPRGQPRGLQRRRLAAIQRPPSAAGGSAATYGRLAGAGSGGAGHWRPGFLQGWPCHSPDSGEGALLCLQEEGGGAKGVCAD